MVALKEPLGGPGALRRAAPFGAFMLLAFVLAPLPPLATAGSGLLEAAVLMWLIVLAVLLAPWDRLPRWAHAVPPLACLAVVALLRSSEGGAVSGFSVLCLVPLFWFALYGSRAELIVAIGAIGVTLAGPALLFGAPEYPSTEWERVILWTFGSALIGPTVQQLVRRTREQAVQLGRLALTDSLTGLPNLRAWQDRLSLEVARAERYCEPLCLILADIDGLKAINDRSGHQFGDQTIKSAAAAWRDQLREGDFIARVGGDEFGILLPSTRDEQGAYVADRLRAATPAGIRASFGIAGWTSGDTEEFIRQADAGLYAAKRRGGNQVMEMSDLLVQSRIAGQAES